MKSKNYFKCFRIQPSNARVLCTILAAVLLSASTYGQTDTAFVQAASTETDYGALATFNSGIITAPDGKATYKVSVKVNAGDATSSIFTRGEKDGIITWGVKSAVDVEKNKPALYYKINRREKTGAINNIQIKNFDAGGGSLTEADISNVSFYSLRISSYNKLEDSLFFVIATDTFAIADGETTPNPEVVFSDSVTGPVTSFSIASGIDPWMAHEIKVLVNWGNSTSINRPYLTERLGIAPNPVVDQFTIAEKPLSTEIYSLSGKLIKKYPEGVSDFNVSFLHPGVYIVQAKTERGNVVVEKLVKK